MAIDLGNTPTGTPPTAGEKLQIRSAIGVGTTDAPTFFNILTSNSNLAIGSISGKNRVDGAGTVPYAIRFISNLDQLGGIKLGEDGINLGGTYLTGPNTDTLYQRNGLTAQNFWVANSVTNASPTTNYDRGVFGWTSNALRIGTENGGSYTLARPIEFVTGGVARWQISAAGDLLPSTTNFYDIGSQSGNRPKTIWATNGIQTAGGDLSTFGGAGPFYLQSATGRAICLISNTSVIQIGGTTSAFPAIKRNGTGIDIRLADDSAFAPLSSGALTIAGNGKFTGTYPYVELRPSAWANPFYFQSGVTIDGSGTGDYTLFLNPSGKGFNWIENNVARFVILPTSGNIGIGTTTPASKLQVTAGDIEVDTIAKGVILKSPDGTRYRVTAANGGTLSVAAV